MESLSSHIESGLDATARASPLVRRPLYPSCGKFRLEHGHALTSELLRVTDAQDVIYEDGLGFWVSVHLHVFKRRR